MNKKIKFIARTFAILFVLITTLFVLDLKQFSWSGLLIYLLPSFILLIILIISWLQEKIGGVLWILVGLIYIILVWGKVDWLTYLLMIGPVFIIGILFIVYKNDTMHIPNSINSQKASQPVVNENDNN